MPSRLLSKNIKIKIWKNHNFPVVLCECETSFLTFSEQHGLSGPQQRKISLVFLNTLRMAVDMCQRTLEIVSGCTQWDLKQMD
jgi:hypothetical protein